MIQANELRIGNLVINHLNGIYTIKPNNILAQYQFDVAGEEGYKPIPITEEWLLKFGFKKDVENTPEEALDSVFLYTKDRFFVFYCHENKMIMVDYVSNKVTGRLTTIITYVHQLQNLYFALTQTELKINE